MIDDYLLPFVFTVGVIGAVTLIIRQAERKWPLDPNVRESEVIADWKVTIVNFILASVVQPFAAIVTVALVAAAGGGFIKLRTDGWWYAVSLVGYVLAADLYRYTAHRIQHAVPALWAMHSFHHSAEALTFLTGARHYWMERAIEGAFFPILAILFEVPPGMVGIVGFIYFLPDACAHVNIRIPLGRCVTWLNNPQWHRIHHSTPPEHIDTNFASLLPLWDILFGTAVIPHPNEYPPTGIVPGEKVSVLDSIVWPFRHYLRRLPVGLWKPHES
jgi:sterol desaturase/sphingolipid hydroxylase (fatty acid hydroxylase superfamily)